MTQEKKDFLYKILLLGDSSVGKTCFLMRYADNTFQEIHMSTIGLDYKFKDVQLDNGKTVKVQIWDTAGQDRFRSITRNYYKGAHGIIVIYDVTNRKTFENVKNWIRQIKDEVSSKVSISLVGNKIDDSENRKVSEEEGKNLADSFGVVFFEASAKDGIGVNECFLDLVKKTVNVYGHSANNSNGEKISAKNDNNKKKGCC